MIFCTLFDSNYLDKGIVTYQSLRRVAYKMQLYVLAMDDKCYEILMKKQYPDMVVISLTEFMTPELNEVKKERTRAEFCWTCTASLIQFIFEKYQKEYCTYIDADLFFYENPRCLLNEMKTMNSSVQVVEHGFGNDKDGEVQTKFSGRFCVEFNTFRNDTQGLAMLDTWRRQCISKCDSNADGNTFGDQKYLDEWPEKYPNLCILKNLGAGIAPWNVHRFHMANHSNNKIELIEKKTKEKFSLVFYHFHNISYLDKKVVNINVFGRKWMIDRKLVYQIYLPYLKQLDQVKEELSREFGFTIMLKQHPGIGTDRQKSGQKKRIRNITLSKLVKFINCRAREKLTEKYNIIKW